MARVHCLILDILVILILLTFQAGIIKCNELDESKKRNIHQQDISQKLSQNALNQYDSIQENDDGLGEGIMLLSSFNLTNSDDNTIVEVFNAITTAYSANRDLQENPNPIPNAVNQIKSANTASSNPNANGNTGGNNPIATVAISNNENPKPNPTIAVNQIQIANTASSNPNANGNPVGPSKVRCTNSTQCADAEYCSIQGDRREGKAICMACNATENGSGCVGAWAIPGGIEECKTRCAEQYECNSHDDCGGANSTDWCSQNLRCNKCNDGACWTTARITGLMSLRWREFPPVSINLACPKACCDWGFESQLNTGETQAVGPCDQSLAITAYWTVGAEPNMTLINALNGKACVSKVYNFSQQDLEIYDPTGYPEKVTLLSCDYGTDANNDITLSVLSRKGGNVSFLSNFYPTIKAGGVNKTNAAEGGLLGWGNWKNMTSLTNWRNSSLVAPIGWPGIKNPNNITSTVEGPNLNFSKPVVFGNWQGNNETGIDVLNGTLGNWPALSSNNSNSNNYKPHRTYPPHSTGIVDIPVNIFNNSNLPRPVSLADTGSSVIGNAANNLTGDPTVTGTQMRNNATSSQGSNNGDATSEGESRVTIESSFLATKMTPFNTIDKDILDTAFISLIMYTISTLDDDSITIRRELSQEQAPHTTSFQKTQQQAEQEKRGRKRRGLTVTIDTSMAKVETLNKCSKFVNVTALYCSIATAKYDIVVHANSEDPSAARDRYINATNHAIDNGYLQSELNALTNTQSYIQIYGPTTMQPMLNIVLRIEAPFVVTSTNNVTELSIDDKLLIEQALEIMVEYFLIDAEGKFDKPIDQKQQQNNSSNATGITNPNGSQSNNTNQSGGVSSHNNTAANANRKESTGPPKNASGNGNAQIAAGQSGRKQRMLIVRKLKILLELSSVEIVDLKPCPVGQYPSGDLSAPSQNYTFCQMGLLRYSLFVKDDEQHDVEAAYEKFNQVTLSMLEDGSFQDELIKLEPKVQFTIQAGVNISTKAPTDPIDSSGSGTNNNGTVSMNEGNNTGGSTGGNNNTQGNNTQGNNTQGNNQTKATNAPTEVIETPSTSNPFFGHYAFKRSMLCVILLTILNIF